MHDMKLTGAWAGYEFRNNTLVSPQGHAFNHDDLRWLASPCQSSTNGNG